MKALITQREITDNYGVKCDSLESPYIRYFEEIGVDLIPVSNFQDNVPETDLIILTGGGEINNGQENRDVLEKKLFNIALDKNLPVLGICRGMQYINFLLGGRLSKLSNLKIERKIGIDHKVQLNGKYYDVNNYHNNGIYTKDLAKDLEILALDVENDVVEACYSNKHKILCFQWHPERKFSDKDAYNMTKELIIKFFNGEKL